MKKWFVALLSVFMLMGSAFAAVNINTATLEQLESLNGIGPSKAQAILDYRAKTPFKAPEDIMKVPGIKEGTFNKIKGDISVSGNTTAVAAPAAATKAPAAAAKTTTPAPATAATPTPKPTKPPKPSKTKASQ